MLAPSPFSNKTAFVRARHTAVYTQTGGRKENSKIARLKRQLEKLGIKGIGDGKDSITRHKTSPSKLLSAAKRGDRGVGGGVNSLTLNSPTDGYGAIASRFSPSNGRGNGVNGKVFAAKGGGGGDGRGGTESTALTLAALSPKRVRSSLSMGGRRLSAWTFGSGGNLTTASVAAAEGDQGSLKRDMEWRVWV